MGVHSVLRESLDVWQHQRSQPETNGQPPESSNLVRYRHPAGAMILRPAGGAMRRREFITLIGGAAAWPLAVRAEQDRMQRIAMVTAGADENDPDARANNAAFVQTMQQLGWADGRN